MKRIPLNLGRWPSGKKATLFALVDDADFAAVSIYRWHTVMQNGTTYARTNIIADNGERTPLSMHRLVLGATAGLIDHRDRNGLNNRRKNLRFCTKSQNAMNSLGHRDRKSKHKGVSFEKFTGRWLGQLTVNGKRVFKKRYDTEEEAAAGYKQAAALYHKEFSAQ